MLQPDCFQRKMRYIKLPANDLVPDMQNTTNMKGQVSVSPSKVHSCTVPDSTDSKVNIILEKEFKRMIRRVINNLERTQIKT
jgi:hypothetical protein